MTAELRDLPWEEGPGLCWIFFLVRVPPPVPGGKNEIYNWENLVGPFLVHKLLDPRTPPPPQQHLCLTVECITSGLHLSVF